MTSEAKHHAKPVAKSTAEFPNAFIGKALAPGTAELEKALGASATAWSELVRELEQEGITEEEWKAVYPNKYGWSLRLKQKKRNIVYLSPCAGFFRVGFILSDKAMEAARKTAFPKPVAEVLAHAPRYPEGNGVRLTVHSARDLPPICKLAHLKMEN